MLSVCIFLLSNMKHSRNFAFFATTLIAWAVLLFAACSGGNTPDDTPAELAELNKQIEKNPNDASAFYQRANYYLEKGFLQYAEDDVRKALELDAEKVDYYCLLADVLYAKGDVVGVNETLETALQKDSKCIPAYMKLAELRLVQQQYDEMNRYLDAALEIDARNPRAYFMRGFAYKEQGDTAAAIRSMLVATNQDAEYYDAYIQLGLMYHARHDAMALDFYNNALTVRPQSTEALYNMAMFYQEMGKGLEAMSLYEKIVAIDPNHKDAYHNMGWLHLNGSGDYKTAIEDFTQAIEIDSTFVTAIYNRGLAFERLNMYDAALQDYGYALKIYPNYTLAEEAYRRVNKLVGLK